MRRLWLVTICLLVAFFLSAVLLGEARAVPPAPTPTPDPVIRTLVQDYPRVDGSTSAFPLNWAVACALLHVECQWGFGDPFSFPPFFEVPEGSDPDQINHILDAIQKSGTHDAYVNLIEGRTDLILVARAPSDDERRAADEAGVALDLRPVARDAFVILLHRDNPLDSLSVEAIRSVYTGETTTWSQLGVRLPGGEDGINAYQRDPNSGSQELMESLIMQGEPMIEGPDMVLPTMIGLMLAVENDPQGIGYSVYFYVTHLLLDEGEEPTLKMAAIDGIAPSSETIRAGSYPFVTEVYAVTRADMPAGSTALQLRDWLLAPAGQAVIEQSGYVGLAAP